MAYFTVQASDRYSGEVTTAEESPTRAEGKTVPGEPRWLNADEQHAWMTLTSLMIRLESALDAQLRRDAGIRHFEYGVMAALSQSPDRTLRMSTLASVADGSLSRLSQVVSRLEKKGWVHRSPDPGDGRYTLATLTDAGNEKVVATAPGHVAEVRRLVFDGITKTQTQQLTIIGQRILNAISPDDDCPSPRP